MTQTLKRLPLHELHLERGGRFGAFGGWEVPVYFSSILEEHEAVRAEAGLFDISHMGEILIGGREARGFLDSLIPRRVERLEDGKALYVPLLNEGGGILDDTVLYQWDREKYLLIVNAANREKDIQWIRQFIPAAVELEDLSDERFLFALQGPRSVEMMEALFHCEFRSLGYYHFLLLDTSWGELLISRTGYTGEDGFEVRGEMAQAASLWKAMLETGNPRGLVPAGFGARDTLRLEAGMRLHGQDMDDTTSAVEAGLGWAVDWEKTNFIGRERNLEEKQNGSARRLVGFEMAGRAIARHGYPVEKLGQRIGQVTSGSFSPSLKKNIGLAYVPRAEAAWGNSLEVRIRDQGNPALVVPTPFYRRRK